MEGGLFGGMQALPAAIGSGAGIHFCRIVRIAEAIEMPLPMHLCFMLDF